MTYRTHCHHDTDLHRESDITGDSATTGPRLLRDSYTCSTCARSSEPRLMWVWGNR